MHNELTRIERKLDLVLQLQGMTLGEIKDLEAQDDAAIQALVDKLKKSGAALKAVVDANQPK